MKESDFSVFNEFTIEKLHTSHEGQLYMLSFKDRKFEVTEGVYQLVVLLQQHSSLEGVAAVYSEMRGKKSTAENIRQFIETNFLPILESDGTNQLKRPFLASKPIISARKLRPVTSVLRVLFSPLAFYPLLSLSVFLQVYFFSMQPTQTSFSFQGNELLLLAAGFLVFVSVMFHELGHASAACYYKASHGHIGIGIYLYYPVFFADVTGAWKLPRGQRAVIDIAGVYFQLLFLIPVTLLYVSSGNEIFRYCIYMIDLSFIFDINPFFKFDGYWLLSDILGVPNLRKRTYEIVPYLVKRLRGKKTKPAPFLLNMKLPEQLTMVGYTIIANIFFGYFFLYKIPVLVSQYLRTYPEVFLQLIKAIKEWAGGKGFSDFLLVQPFFFQTFFLLITLLMLYRLLRFLIKGIVKMIN